LLGRDPRWARISNRFRSYAEQTKQKRQTKSDPNFRVAELDRIDAYFNVRAM